MRVRYSFSSRRTRHTKNIRKQREKYPSILQKVVETSDIILEILDARFIDETRNYEIEEDIKKKDKKLIYVINKSDLTSRENIITNIFPKVIMSCKKRYGIKSLRDLIKKEAKKIKPLNKQREKFEKIVVGVIGYPNTGKSSVINLLIGKKSAGTGSDAGYTKGLQKLKLTSEITLLDSPGVIPSKEYSSENKTIITKNTKVGARSHSQVKDPELVITNLMKEYPEVLQKYYKIKTGSAEHLIEKLGRQKNFLKKGNEVNFDKTSRLIIKDWQEGKIKITNP